VVYSTQVYNVLYIKKSEFCAFFILIIRAILTIKYFVYLIKHHIMTAYWVVVVELHTFLISTLSSEYFTASHTIMLT
jgi:hypothetical protein